MRLLLANIATGQLRHCVSTQQVSLLSRPLFLELRGLKYITSPPDKKLEGLSPRRPPPRGSRATGHIYLRGRGRYDYEPTPGWSLVLAYNMEPSNTKLAGSVGLTNCLLP